MKNLILIFLLLFAMKSNGQSTSCACCTTDHQNFNFWLGEWNVYANEKIVGTNSITSAQDSCILIENWVGNGSVTGTSMNFFDAIQSNWNQLWIDNQGSVLKLKGNFNGKSMVLISDPAIDTSGNVNLHRIKWTPNADNSVRQLWESSKDGGQKWNVLFDGKYVKKN